MRPRHKPYTARGISRVPCARCGAPSTQSWQICSDGNQFRGLCTGCDVGLNAVVLSFVRLPDAEAKIAAYAAKNGVGVPVVRVG